MERRGFLKGLFGGIAAGAGLIVTATPAEVQAFAGGLQRDEPLILDSMPVAATNPAFIGEYLYNAEGQRVAMVTEVEFSCDPFDVTHDPRLVHSSLHRRYIPGQTRIEIKAIGLGDDLRFDFK